MYYKRKHKKHKNRQKWFQDPTTISTKKKFFMTPSETEAMYQRIRENLSCSVRIVN